MLKKKHQQEGSTVAAATSTATADPVIPLLSTISWKDHPEWTDQLIASLLQHPNIRLWLFSDSTDAAKAENCVQRWHPTAPQRRTSLASSWVSFGISLKRMRRNIPHILFTRWSSSLASMDGFQSKHIAFYCYNLHKCGVRWDAVEPHRGQLGQ